MRLGQLHLDTGRLIGPGGDGHLVADHFLHLRHPGTDPHQFPVHVARVTRGGVGPFSIDIGDVLVEHFLVAREAAGIEQDA